MKFNKKIFNLSAWITLLIAYVLPYQSQSSDGHSTYLGYPLSFLTINNTPIYKTLFMTESIDIFTLTIDILIVYFVMHFANVYLSKVKLNKGMNKTKDFK
ncbi:hypothetical protein [Clostridium tagluense]|uniref:hypothetical protein n=1 Tax=Clostridium tagluense TaxID=360422 RepID=UPI001C6F5188|nr:hypothetical protein [Clostridium tagluense]MBW9158498.1 hypothetical protein [Clostridium tagluense]WLC67358.1 hypothetical protein KTC93_09340 [Clostridium tagluense]